ncbi:MAG: hypothetical protein J4G12_05630 [Gemmatimonadetes bacterium]|nr:hypothetical protein [Gemmatimonadota bacterium]
MRRSSDAEAYARVIRGLRASDRRTAYRPLHPLPRTGRPGMASVCAPFSITATPFTKT